MGLELKFQVHENRDAKSFIFTDTTGTYHPTYNAGGWGTPNISKTDVLSSTLELVDPNDQEFSYTFSITGAFPSKKEMFIADFSYTLPYFIDGVYKMRIIVENEIEGYYHESDWSYFGFAAVVAASVMKNSLSYHPREERRKREWILEQQRILNNLKYSADTGNINFFKENLEQLQKIK